MDKIEVKIDGNTLMDYLRSKGCNEQQLNAKVVHIIENGLIDGAISDVKTAEDFINRLERRSQGVFNKIDALESRIYKASNRNDEIKRLLEEAETSVKSRIITDESITNGVNAFTLMLEAVRDTYGEECMTETVICKAIEAGSYGYWRSVMGPKNLDKHQDKRDSRQSW